MANLTAIQLPVYITGDGVSLTAVVDLANTSYSLSGIQNLNSHPTTAAAVASYDSLGANIYANISSVVVSGSQVTITFIAPFTGLAQVILAVSYPVDGSVLTTPVNSASQATAGLLNATVVQAVGSNLHVDVDNFPRYVSVAPANPAAGAGLTIVVPASTQYVINGVRLTLVTSATAGNRIVALEGSDSGGHQLVQCISSYSQPPSTTAVLSFASGNPAMTTPVFFTITQPLAAAYLGPGSTFLIGVVGMQPTDQISNVAFMIQKTTI